MRDYLISMMIVTKTINIFQCEGVKDQSQSKIKKKNHLTLLNLHHHHHHQQPKYTVVKQTIHIIQFITIMYLFTVQINCLMSLLFFLFFIIISHRFCKTIICSITRHITLTFTNYHQLI